MKVERVDEEISGYGDVNVCLYSRCIKCVCFGVWYYCRRFRFSNVVV